MCPLNPSYLVLFFEIEDFNNRSVCLLRVLLFNYFIDLKRKVIKFIVSIYFNIYYLITFYCVCRCWWLIWLFFIQKLVNLVWIHFNLSDIWRVICKLFLIMRIWSCFSFVGEQTKFFPTVWKKIELNRTELQSFARTETTDYIPTSTSLYFHINKNKS